MEYAKDFQMSLQNLSRAWSLQQFGSNDLTFDPPNAAYGHLEFNKNDLFINSTYSVSNVSGGNGSSSPDSDLEAYVPYHQRPETYIVPVLFAIIFIIGVLGNGTLILIFLKHRTMRNVPNMYDFYKFSCNSLNICSLEN